MNGSRSVFLSRLFRGALMFLCCMSMPTLAELNVKLTEPEQGFRLPNETLVLDFSEALTEELAQELSLELDTTDISAMVKVFPNRVEYQPVPHLSAGAHELKLYRYSPDGRVELLGAWPFQVRQSSRFEKAQVDAQYDFQLQQRLAQHHVGHDNELNLNGTARIQGELVGDDFSIKGKMDVVAMSNQQKAPTGNKVDIASYNLQARRESSLLSLGHQSFSDASLLQDGRVKRGVLASNVFKSFDTEVSFFSYGSLDQVGSDNLVGVENSDTRINGARVKSLILENEIAALELSASYYYGRRINDDLAVFAEYTDQAIQEGDAYSLALDGYFFERQLRMRMEGAKTRFDNDGREFGRDAKKDNAWSSLLMFAPKTDQEDPSAANWNLGAESQHVGRYFKSVANPDMPSDRFLWRTFGQLNKDKVVLSGAWKDEHNNVDERDTLATTTVKSWYLNAQYFTRPKEDEWWQTLGVPSFTLGLTGATVEDSASNNSLLKNDSEMSGFSVQTGFAKTGWSWNLLYSENDFEDLLNRQIDTRTRTFGISAAINISADWSLNPGWQRLQIHNQDYDTLSTNHKYSMAARWAVIPKILTTSIEWRQNINEALKDPFFVQNNVNQNWSGLVSWNLREAKNKQAGYQLNLMLSEQEYQDKLFNGNNDSSMQVTLSLRTTMPYSSAGGITNASVY